MNIDDLILTALDHENIPPRVPTFVQGIMPAFFANWEKKYGDDLEEDDVVLTPEKDLTLHMCLGFDSTWCGFDGPKMVPPPNHGEKVKNANLKLSSEELAKGYRIESNGGLYRTVDLQGYPNNFLVGGTLKTEDDWIDWYRDSAWELKYPSKDPIKIYNDSKKIAAETKHPILLIPSCGLIIEPLLGIIDMGRISYFARKKPHIFRQVIDHIMKPSLLKFQLICETEAPIIITPDDCAYKGRPILNPILYREFIIPYWKKYADMAHKAGKKLIMHSDGMVQPYYDDLILAGLDVHQSLEPLAGNNLKDVKMKWGKKLSFIGNMDCSNMLSFGSKEEVIATTKQILLDGMPESGFMFSPCTDLINLNKLENVEAMMATVKKFGVYNSKIF